LTLIFMIIALFVLLASRVPVAFALMIPGLFYVVLDPTAGLSTAAQQTTSGVNNFALLAVPLFILLGNLANESGISDRLFNFGVAFIGHIRGSLGYVNVGTSFAFSWMSGAAIADAAAMGRVQVPAMVSRGYNRGFSLGLTGASSLIAPMIPPSIPAIIYAVTAGVSVGALFLAGIVPALVLVVALCIMVWVQTRKKEELRLPRAMRGERSRTLFAALPAAGAAIIVLGGILSGVFTPTEASGIGVLYLFIVAIAYRALTWKSLRRMLIATVETSGSVLLIVASAGLFAWVLARERAPQLAADLILGISDNPLFFLLLVNVLLLIVGAVLEPAAAILILVPVLAPAAEVLGVDPVHFGIMVIFNLTLGLLTPPVGIVLFVLSSATGAPVAEAIRGVIPFYIPMLAVLIMLAMIPSLTTWLPSLFGLG
jgi:tripartite ATP-independent transporter DctM subunit